LARWDIQRGDVYEILLKLELQGLIKQLPGKYYVKI
jgi:predicted Rossmann fold nucleotide-binding protein DprA/Smf involved in DNA uptake